LDYAAIFALWGFNNSSFNYYDFLSSYFVPHLSFLFLKKAIAESGLVQWFAAMVRTAFVPLSLLICNIFNFTIIFLNIHHLGHAL